MQEMREAVLTDGPRMNSLYGINIYHDRSMCNHIQVRFPRSKKRRMRRKWAKQQKNYRNVPRQEIIQTADGLYAHPETWEKVFKKENIKEAAAAASERLLERTISDVGMGEATPGAPSAGRITTQSLMDSLALLPKVAPRKSWFDWDFMPMPVVPSGFDFIGATRPTVTPPGFVGLRTF